MWIEVSVLTLVCVVLDLEFQLPGVGLHSVHMVLQVLLILFVSVLKLDELLLRNAPTHKHKHTHRAWSDTLAQNPSKLICHYSLMPFKVIIRRVFFTFSNIKVRKNKNLSCLMMLYLKCECAIDVTVVMKPLMHIFLHFYATHMQYNYNKVFDILHI